MLFFSSPSADVRIMIILLVVAFVIALAVYFFSKKILASIFVFSALSNVVLYFGMDYNLAKIYNITEFFIYQKCPSIH